MSIILDYQAEAEAEFLKWLSQWQKDLERRLPSPSRAATVGIAPQDERVPSGSGTAAAGHPFEEEK